MTGVAVMFPSIVGDGVGVMVGVIVGVMGVFVGIGNGVLEGVGVSRGTNGVFVGTADGGSGVYVGGLGLIAATALVGKANELI